MTDHISLTRKNKLFTYDQACDQFQGCFHSYLFCADQFRCVSPGELKGDVNDTLEAFEDMFHLYKSGLHLDNMPSSIIRGMK
jgi:hypothetical protein